MTMTLYDDGCPLKPFVYQCRKGLAVIVYCASHIIKGTGLLSVMEYGMYCCVVFTLLKSWKNTRLRFKFVQKE